MRTEISLVLVNVFLLSLGTSDTFLEVFGSVYRIILDHKMSQNFFWAVVLDSCQVQVSRSDNDSRFLCLDCAYITSCLNVSCSGPARLDAAAQYLIWSFTELRRAHTPSHTQLCVVSLGPFSATDSVAQNAAVYHS